MSPPVIVDTNVVVAGLLTASAESPVARVLDGMLAAAFPFAISASLLAEYREVLKRPSLRKAHRLTAAELDVILVGLVEHAIVLAPPPAPRAPDPGDQHLWELLAARADLVLITGDKRLQKDRAMGPRIFSPAAFFTRWPPVER
ncbi:MAG: putative toxin-antitoxin system toxin component, PIN family [Betaproteobacteria bacterium]|nr:putative toxin-antitoxin system toxin component, PIN family [Betaproteobacteria bacterium]